MNKSDFYVSYSTHNSTLYLSVRATVGVPYVTLIGSLFDLVVIRSLEKAYNGLAQWLTSKENYRTQTHYNDALILVWNK